MYKEWEGAWQRGRQRWRSAKVGSVSRRARSDVKRVGPPSTRRAGYSLGSDSEQPTTSLSSAAYALREAVFQSE